MRNENRFVLPAVLALLLTFCGARADAQVASRAGATASPVKLLEAGAGSRKVLRLHPAVGDKQTMTMTMKMSMIMTAAGNSMPATSIPAMVMTMVVEVNGKAANGDISYKMTIQDATVATDTNSTPGVAEGMKASLASIRGMTGDGKATDHGVNLGIQMKLPAGAAPQMVQTMDQMKEILSQSSYPFPDEAVGPGAKWSNKTQIKTQGMMIDQTTSYELVSIQGDRLTLRLTQTQSAANQKIENPAMPAAMKMNLIKLTGTGAGSSTFSLSHILPVSGTLDSDTDTSMSMDMGQQKQTMDMKMKMNMAIESK